MPVRNEDAGSVQGLEGVACKGTTDIILAIVLLDMLKIGWMIDDVHAEERDRHLIGRTISLVQGVPGLAARSTSCLKLLNVSFEGFALRARDPFGVLGRRRPEAPISIRPANP